MEGGAEFEPASTAVKHLGSCCQDSDNVLDKINALHDKLSRLSKLSREGYPVSMPKNSCRSRTLPLPDFNLIWRPKRGPRSGGGRGGVEAGSRRDGDGQGSYCHTLAGTIIPAAANCQRQYFSLEQNPWEIPTGHG